MFAKTVSHLVLGCHINRTACIDAIIKNSFETFSKNFTRTKEILAKDDY